MLTLFSYDLPIEIAARAIDLYLMDGWKVIFKISLGLLSMIQSQIRHMTSDEFMNFLKTFTRSMNFDEDELAKRAKHFKVTKTMLKDLETLYHEGKSTNVQTKVINGKYHLVNEDAETSSCKTGGSESRVKGK
eukprot:TRINITY_DN14806_c0_g1_i10.p6 TRINITY_DN14806_c0_g1~~TRINITY_DN14806_c0_g1_i10.p6  ORF type:complete len:133 (+),score=46.77 TRINITY_DN14806_c0_g1_i10:1387-1785(+)